VLFAFVVLELVSSIRSR